MAESDTAANPPLWLARVRADAEVVIERTSAVSGVTTLTHDPNGILVKQVCSHIADDHPE